jgi:hypothetical protein
MKTFLDAQKLEDFISAKSTPEDWPGTFFPRKEVAPEDPGCHQGTRNK